MSATVDDVLATSSNYNAGGFIKFFNEDAFIKVFNGQTGVYAYFNKDLLVLQKDSELTFFLKSGDYTGYYNYEDVAYPSSDNLKSLLAILSNWCNKAILNDSQITDAMSRLRTSTFRNVLGVSALHDKSPLVIDEVTAGLGESSTLLANTVRMASSASNGSMIIRQSKHYAPHYYGGTSMALVAGTLTTDPAASNVRTRIGVFDDNASVTLPDVGPHGNGLFFQWDAATGIACGYRTNIGGSQVDQIVPQNEWNQDLLIDSGSVGYTLTPSNDTTYVFQWCTHDPTRIARVGVMAGGTVKFVHHFTSSNVPGMFGHPALPVRWELKHAADLGAVPSAVNMIQGSASVMTDVDGQLPRRIFSQDNGTLFKTLAAAGEVPLFSLRLAAAYARAKIHPKKLSLVNSQQGAIAKWSLVLNPTLTGATWASTDPGLSWAEYTNTETAYSGGLVVGSGFVVGAGVTEVDISDQIAALSSRMTGITDVLTVVLKYIQGTCVLNGGMEWVETE